jgi:uncharacterized membrane protein
MKELLSAFAVSLLTAFIYFQVPVLDTVSIILLWVIAIITSVVITIACFFWEELLSKTKEGISTTKVIFDTGHMLLNITACYFLYLAGREYLSALLVIIAVVTLFVVYKAIRHE